MSSTHDGVCALISYRMLSGTFDQGRARVYYTWLYIYRGAENQQQVPPLCLEGPAPPPLPSFYPDPPMPIEPPPVPLVTDILSLPTLIPDFSLDRSYVPFSMFSYIIWDVYRNASSTLMAVLADVSKNISPFSLANRSPSSVETYLRWSRSLLLPISIMTMSGFPFYLTSSSQRVRWLKVSRRVMS